ncbi:DUF262 domain-containing protein [Candidatus Peribacteria bacterium]|nr:MAG: DUF262 domain-containing protein [Candidatus Peribacteria bacterium]
MERRPTLHDISWFLDQSNFNKLNLDPPYQRRSVWTAKDRKFLLDTIFRNYPFPPIFLHQDKDDNGSATYNVVDGKQRIQTIIMFTKDEIAIDRDFGDTNLNGKKFSELDSKYKKIFWDYVVLVDYIDIPSGEEVNEVFDRVNRNARKLVEQELRHARYEGWFIKEAETEALAPFWEKIKLSTKANIRRMRDVQLVSELLLITIDNKIEGFNQDYLDKRYSELDSIEGIEFDEEAYQEKKSSIKSIIEDMVDSNDRCIDFIKTGYNLYTLWAVLTLNNITEDHTVIAENYLKFLDKVSEFKNEEDADSFLATHDASYKNAYEYFVNTSGASTDFKQRKARYDALKSALLD